MRYERESNCAPADIDVRVMVFLLGLGGYLADRLDAVEERGKLDRAAQGPVAAFPAVEVGQCGVDLFVR